MRKGYRPTCAPLSLQPGHTLRPAVYEERYNGMFFWDDTLGWLRGIVADWETLEILYGKGDILMSSCCNGQGGSRWNDKNQQWDCTDCGAIQSNDPSYLGGSKPVESPWKHLNTAKKCECGSSTVGSDRHSDYCPLYKKV